MPAEATLGLMPNISDKGVFLRRGNGTYVNSTTIDSSGTATSDKVVSVVVDISTVL